jgi:mannose-6-phosphate isomerase-like protein (cupin superfamily)
LSLPHQLTVERAVAALPEPPGERYAELFRQGTLRIGLYAPRGQDPQGPHTQDEVYVVLKGTGWFANGPSRDRFGPGDVLFVPAGTVHRFEEFTADFQVWVIFYGPQGGERATPSG